MGRLERALAVALGTAAAASALAVARGIVTGAWPPMPAALYVGAVLGAVAAWLDAALRGGGDPVEPDLVPAMPADRLRHLRRAAERPSDADRAFATAMVAGMVAQVAHEQDMSAARGHEQVVVRLVPRIPTGDRPVTSWIGGGPALPAGVAWPEQDGTPLTFLAQLDCATLPVDLWDGLGPRRGALAFFVHPETVAPTILRIEAPGVPAAPRGAGDACFFYASGRAWDKKPSPYMTRAFPRWPVDPIAVRSGDNDPRVEEDQGHGPSLYDQGFDLTDPAHQPFDWHSTLAMLDVLEEKIAFFWRPLPPGPNRLDQQLERTLTALAEAEAAPEPPASLQRLRNAAADLPLLIRLSAEALAVNDAAREAVIPIVAEARERAAAVPFTPAEATAIVDRLGAIEWVKLLRHADPSRGEGAERYELARLPLTRHDARATLWVYDFEKLRFDMARHAYAADPDRLPPPVRAQYEARWATIARHEMAGTGHVPFRFVHQFDPAEEVTLLELPTSDLLGWMWGDVDDLVLTMRKADLAAERWDRVLMQVTN